MPDLRFGQLISLLRTGCSPGVGGTYFYLEDNEFERAIDAELVRIENERSAGQTELPL